MPRESQSKKEKKKIKIGIFYGSAKNRKLATKNCTTFRGIYLHPEHQFLTSQKSLFTILSPHLFIINLQPLIHLYSFTKLITLTLTT